MYKFVCKHQFNRCVTKVAATSPGVSTSGAIDTNKTVAVVPCANATGDYEERVAKALATLKEQSVHSISNSASMMVVMTEEQKRMLGRYGRVTCMDATYRVVQWGLPFFLLVVVDEHHFSFPAAYFMVAEESAISIAEVIARIKGLVPIWDPGVFIMDKSDAEIGAVKRVFPNAVIILCEFHVKQAWLRWLKTSANGVPKEAVNIIYKVLCEVMKATSTRVAKQKVQLNLSAGQFKG